MRTWLRKAAFVAAILPVSLCAAQTNRVPREGCCATNRGAKPAHDSSARAEAKRFGDRVEALLHVAPAAKGEWGILVVDAKTGETRYERNADSYFVPASNMKLFTTALALARLGPDYQFHTTIETRGVISPDGKLSGDAILVGRGDPNLSNRKFPFALKEEFDGPPERVVAELADALVARGVKEIAGDIVGDDSYFPRERYPDGWEIDDMVWEYGAAISAIVVDDNTVTVTLTPGEKAGDPVAATVDPLTPDFSLDHEVTTSAAEVKSDVTLTREPGGDVVLVRGSLPAGSAARKLVLAIEEPAQHAAALLARLLEERGVRIDGIRRAGHSPDSDSNPRTVLAEHVSVPLAEALKLINKISQNLHTEMLLRTVVRQTGMWTTPEELFKVPQDFYAQVGIGPEDIVQTDGSGLSRHDLITPRAAVKLLQFAEAQSWFPPYFDSLPVAGVDGSLQDRMKGTIAEGRVHAKTGSLRHVRTLSGFADTPSGRRLIFSFLSNNENGKSHETTDTLNALCIAMLEEFDRAPRVASAGEKLDKHKTN